MELEGGIRMLDDSSYEMVFSNDETRIQGQIHIFIESRSSADRKVRELYDATTEMTSRCLYHNLISSTQEWTAIKFPLYFF